MNDRRVLVPVTDEPSSLAAVQVACDYARREKITVEVLHVIEVPRALAIDADLDAASRRGEVVLRRAEDLAGPGCTVRGELLQARNAAAAIIDEVRKTRAELVVMGIGARPSGRGFHLSETSATVLREVDCRVWLIREAAPE